MREWRVAKSADVVTDGGVPNEAQPANLPVFPQLGIARQKINAVPPPYVTDRSISLAFRNCRRA
jgi:hypothetical protein